MRDLNFQTFWIWRPDIFTFRLLGFGVVAYDWEALGPEMQARMERQAWFVPILPGWRFAYVAPWV